ncbi:MAG TPA: DUF1801 domain-containing protein [Clostridia bacterium]|jgi:hypothetical protein|nr:DUF1801 domain-containing protein [Clostridia bacterium]
MSSIKKHPHIERPSAEQIISVLQDKTPMIRQLYLDTHMLILETLPDVAYSIDCDDGQMGYGARQYGYDGWGMAALSAHSKWVSLVFMRGTDLEDPNGLLEGTGKSIRHVKLRSPEQAKERRSALEELIRAASKLYG